jgi:hypothetical protein
VPRKDETGRALALLVTYSKVVEKNLPARMSVPKLVCEVSYASCLAWSVCVYGCLGCEEHDEQAELSVQRYFDQSSQVVLG